MDPLTRFNSVGRRAPSTAAQLQDLARATRRGARPNTVTVRAWPPAAADDGEDWDAVIARAKAQAAALPRQTRPRQPAPPTYVPPELQVTPPPVPVRQAPSVSAGRLHTQQIRTAEEVRAKLDVVVWGTANRSAGLRPASHTHRTAEEDMVTPPPVRTDGGAAGPRPRR